MKSEFLKQHTVEFLDPFISSTLDEAIAFLMTPIIDSFWLLKRFCSLSLITHLTTEPFTCSHTTGLYDNKSDGVCGPVSAKLFEMHAHGMDYANMAAFTDEVVTRIRKGYAMDTYAAFVECEYEF